jgi:hypothetical protein
MNYPFNIENLKGFSIKQPWASLIIKNIKDIENRTWGADNEKWLLVHSSKEYDKNTLKTKPNIVNKLKNIKWENYPTGKILGIIHVTNVESNCDIDKYFWATGPKCWHIDFAYEFDNPIESIGARSFWSPNSNVMNKVIKELSNNQFVQSLYIYQFCKTLNTLYLHKQDKKTHKTCKDIVTAVYNNNKYNLPNKLQINILNNYYNYHKPTIKPSQPNHWDNTQGFIATPLYVKGADKFQHQLLEGANNWFHSYLKNYPELKKYNITNIETLKNLIDSTWRNKNLTKEQNKAIRNALDGGGNAQFQPYKGWRLSGFGIWNHIRGAKYVYKTVLPATLKVYKKLYNRPIKIKSLPHLIFKPPSEKSGELLPHNDHGTWNDMYTRCLLCDSVSEWVENYGIQMLTHIEGARKGQGGQTTLLGPMDVPTYLIILQLIHPKTTHDELPVPTDGWDKEWYTAAGPKFYKWYKREVLLIINRIVKIIKTGDKPIDNNDKKWIEKVKINNYYNTLVKKASKSKYQKIEKIKIIPSEPFNSAYSIAWPSGFIHGSDKTGKVPRLTLTIPYDSIGNKEKSNRGFIRLKHLSNKKMNKVLQDNKPYEDGIVHKATKTEVEIHPYFEHIYLKPKDMDKIEYLFD